MKNFVKEVYKPLIVFITLAILFYGSMYLLVYLGKLTGVI
jgi:hypothetical protein